jgi:hypothetical protein
MIIKVIILNIFLYFLLESATVDAETTTQTNLTEVLITSILTGIQGVGVDGVSEKISPFSI